MGEVITQVTECTGVYQMVNEYTVSGSSGAKLYVWCLCFSQECVNENRSIVYDLIASHGDIEDMVFFAVIMQGRVTGAGHRCGYHRAPGLSHFHFRTQGPSNKTVGDFIQGTRWTPMLGAFGMGDITVEAPFVCCAVASAAWRPAAICISFLCLHNLQKTHSIY